MKIIGYTFEADHHCIRCTRQRAEGRDCFRLNPASLNRGDATASDEHGIPIHAIDNEGNPIHPMFSTDEQLETVACGDCRAIIYEVEKSPAQ